MWIISNLLPFLLILTTLVFIHELGHFLVARFNGVKVSVFSIGFGPELFGWTDHHKTRWSFSLIPLGGYVRMLGDTDPSGTKPNMLDESEQQYTLASKPPLQQIAVASAGPIANIILAVVLSFLIIFIKGEPVSEPVISKIESGMHAEKSGLMVDDKIIKINNMKIKTFSDIKEAIATFKGTDAIFTIVRNGQSLEQNIALYNVENNIKTPVDVLGIRPGNFTYKHHSLITTIFKSVHVTYDICANTVYGLYKLITGQQKGKDFGGIISIGDMASKSFQSGLIPVMWLMMVLSINLGIINLLPIPVLDGGHILLSAIHLVRGRALSKYAQEKVFMVGLLIVGSAMIYATWNDLVKYKVLQTIFNWF